MSLSVPPLFPSDMTMNTLRQLNCNTPPGAHHPRPQSSLTSVSKPTPLTPPPPQPTASLSLRRRNSVSSTTKKKIRRRRAKKSEPDVEANNTTDTRQSNETVSSPTQTFSTSSTSSSSTSSSRRTAVEMNLRLQEMRSQRGETVVRGICEICGDDEANLIKTRFMESNENFTTPKCKGEHHYCKDCMFGWIESEIGDNKSSVQCPHPDCTRKLSHTDIFRHAPDLFDRFSELASSDFATNTKELMKDKKMKRWVAQNTRKCPDCSVVVERAHGCNSMRCLCGQGFCWVCSQKSGVNNNERESQKHCSQCGAGCCSYCANAGHRQRHCADRLIRRTCEACGETNHLKRNCPQLRFRAELEEQREFLKRQRQHHQSRQHLEPSQRLQTPSPSESLASLDSSVSPPSPPPPPLSLSLSLSRLLFLSSSSPSSSPSSTSSSTTTSTTTTTTTSSSSSSSSSSYFSFSSLPETPPSLDKKIKKALSQQDQKLTALRKKQKNTEAKIMRNDRRRADQQTLRRGGGRGGRGNGRGGRRRGGGRGAGQNDHDGDNGGGDNGGGEPRARNRRETAANDDPTTVEEAAIEAAVEAPRLHFDDFPPIILL